LIALVVTREGIPLGYELFGGNVHDAATVKSIVEKMESRYGAADRIWVMDRGMTTEENIAFLRTGGRRYIIGTARSMLKDFERELLSGPWDEIREGLEVQLCPSPYGEEELFILCRSRARQEKERAIHDRFIRNIEEGLTNLHKSCEEGRARQLGVIERRVGRLLERNRRAAALFEVKVEQDPLTGKFQLRWRFDEAHRQWARRREGCYLVRTNIRHWSAEELWQAYTHLTEAEAAFRIHKSDLKLRPIWHQKPERVGAHILVCFLAYVLWKCFAQLCEHSGLGNEPRKVIDEIRQLKLTDVVLPTRQGPEIRLRCVTRPEKALELLLERLHLVPPQRLMSKFNL